MGKYHHRPASIHTTPFFNRTTKMPSMRRVKLFSLLIFLFAVALLFYTASLRQSRELDSRTVGDFYDKTVNALNKNKNNKNDVGGTDDEIIAKKMAESLKDAEKAAKDTANAKAPKPDPPSSVIGVGSAADGARDDERSVAGRKKFREGGEAQEPVEESEEEHEIEVELNAILKKSPIIIFSKSYCPHSRRAKGILLEKYIIDPAPYVVELDQHPIGLGMQAHLADLTGRRTVPNVMINGVSIGGGDDVADLDAKRTLIDKIKDLGGKKMLDVRLKPIEEEKPGLR